MRYVWLPLFMKLCMLSPIYVCSLSVQTVLIPQKTQYTVKFAAGVRVSPVAGEPVCVSEALPRPRLQRAVYCCSLLCLLVGRFVGVSPTCYCITLQFCFFLFLHVWWFQIVSFICDGWNSSQHMKTRRCSLGKRRVAIHVFANFQHLLLSLSFNWMPSPISKVWMWRKLVFIWSAFDFIFIKITKWSSCKLESSVNKYASGSILAVISRVPFSKQSQSNPKSWLGGVSYLAARNVWDSSVRDESGGSIGAFKLHDLLSLTNIHNRYYCYCYSLNSCAHSRHIEALYRNAQSEMSPIS